MRGAFPTKQLGNDLDALYSEAFSVVNDTVSALAELEAQYGWLAIESKEPSPAGMTLQSEQEILDAAFEGSGELDPDVAPILKRCHELLFLALATAANQINAALKSPKKKK